MLVSQTFKNGSTSAGFPEFFEDLRHNANSNAYWSASTADVTLTLPATDTLVGKATTDTLQIKHLQHPITPQLTQVEIPKNGNKFLLVFRSGEQ